MSVAVFEDVNDGRLLEIFLREMDIHARTYNDKLLQNFLFLCPPRVTYRVQVRKNHYVRATEVLETAPPPVLDKAFQCPTCGSLRVNYPQMTRKFFFPTILLHLGIIFRIIDHECYCENCHHIWNLPREGVIPKSQAARPFFPFK